MSDAFALNRPRLSAIAYRMLGVRADAEDAVQETAIRWIGADRDGIANAQAWLTRVCTRICIDMLRRRRADRDSYVGPWLPEPVDEPAADVPALAESLRLAFLLMLERLSPNERAALLLHDVFDADYAEVAAALGASEAACRQHVSRARRHLAAERARFAVAPRAEAELMSGFSAAVASGDVAALGCLMAPDVRLVSDGGGKALAARNIVEGADRVARFFAGIARKVPEDLTWRQVVLNGAPALVGMQGGRVFGTLSLATDGEAISGLFFVRNPDKLGALTVH